MGPDEVRAWLGQRPFRPFRLHLTNGVTFDIRHPDQAVVGRRTVVLSRPVAASQSGADVERDVEIALLHITHLEPIPSPPPPSSN